MLNPMIRTRLYYLVHTTKAWASNRRTRRSWIANGFTSSPPAAYKRQTVRAYGRHFGSLSLIETGTYRGEMLWANRRHFQHLYSVEAAPSIYEETAARLRGIKTISLRLGPSTHWLPRFIADSASPRLFWLDAHYSGGPTAGRGAAAPIINELDTIFRSGSPADVILIDDARLFQGKDGYPSYAAVAALAERGKRCCYLDRDIIRIHAGEPIPFPDRSFAGDVSGLVPSGIRRAAAPGRIAG